VRRERERVKAKKRLILFEFYNLLFFSSIVFRFSMDGTNGGCHNGQIKERAENERKRKEERKTV
jgi:hypothetical protein